MRDFYMKPTGEQGVGGSGGGIAQDTCLLPSEVTAVPTDLLRTYPHTKRVGRYLLGRLLGEGSFAKVKEGLHIVTGETVAIKVVDKHRAKDDAYVRKNLKREGHLLQRLRHRHVVQLYEILETDNSYYLVTELCRGGDLIQHIYARRRLNERQTRRFVRQIISAVDYMHKAGIIHRDLKIENLLLDEKKNIKIIDFGLSNMIRVAVDSDGTVLPQEYCVTQCGSPAYAAPELIGNDKYGPLVDVWSIGINMFAMLTGTLPFTVDPFNIKVLHSKMVKGDMNPLPEHLTPECRDLLKRLLTPDPTQRIQLGEAMNHPWLIGSQGRAMVPAPFPNTLSAGQVNTDIVQHMAVRLNFAPTDVVRQVCSNTPSSAFAIYCLLQRRLARYQPRKSPQTPPSSGESVHDQAEVEDEVKLKSFRHTRKSRLRKRLTERVDIADSRLPAAQQVQPCPPGKSRQENEHASNQPEVEEDKVTTIHETSPTADRNQREPKSEGLVKMENGSMNSGNDTVVEVAAIDDCERSSEVTNNNNNNNAVIASSDDKTVDNQLQQQHQLQQQQANSSSSRAESRLPTIVNSNSDAEHHSKSGATGAGKLLTRRNSSRVTQSPLRKQGHPADQFIGRPLPAVAHNGSRVASNTTAAQQRIAASRAAAAANGRNSVSHNRPSQAHPVTHDLHQHQGNRDKERATDIGDLQPRQSRPAATCNDNTEPSGARVTRLPAKSTLPSLGEDRRPSMAAAASCSMESAELPPIVRMTPKVHAAAAECNAVVLPSLLASFN